MWTGTFFANHKYIDEICSLFGSELVAFMSIDDKARVPIGLTAAKSQAPMLRHMEYKVK